MTDVPRRRRGSRPGDRSARRRVATAGDALRDGDALAEVRDAEFPDELRVASGGATFVDNRDLFRHTFTVAGTDLDVELPARQGVRFTVDLAPGPYEVICAVPGHESMTSTLLVD